MYNYLQKPAKLEITLQSKMNKVVPKYVEILHITQYNNLLNKQKDISAIRRVILPQPAAYQLPFHLNFMG